MTDSEQEQPVAETEYEAPQFTLPEVVPQEGESYMAAYDRMLREAAGITPEQIEDGETDVLGVLTGQVPVRSMPIAMNNPIGPEEDTVSEDEGSV